MRRDHDHCRPESDSTEINLRWQWPSPKAPENDMSLHTVYCYDASYLLSLIWHVWRGFTPSGSRQCCFFFGAKPNTTKKEAQKKSFQVKKSKVMETLQSNCSYDISLDQESSQEYHFTTLSFAHDWRSIRRPEIKDWRWKRRRWSKDLFFFARTTKSLSAITKHLFNHQK